jgi:hypothetical protein
MRIKISILLFILYCIFTSCDIVFKDKRPNEVVKHQDAITKDTLKEVVFDNGLRAILCRDAIEGRNHIFFFINDSLITQTKLPTSIDYSGFSVNYIRKDKNYLLFSVEHGTRNYYQTNFYFLADLSNPFSLQKIEGKCFDKVNPNKWSERDSILNPPSAIIKFNIEQYFDNGW